MLITHAALDIDPAVPYDPVPGFRNCGMPNFVSDVRALHALVKGVARRQGRPLRIVEIGAWAGRTALTMLHAADCRADIHCFDLWFVQGDGWFGADGGDVPILRGFAENVGEYLFRSIHPHPGRSEFWASVWREPLDFVYIDGDHSYEGVLRDIRAWTPHVRRGGVIAGHDFRCAEVSRAVQATGACSSLSEGGMDPNRHLFGDPDLWGGVWWRQL